MEIPTGPPEFGLMRRVGLPRRLIGKPPHARMPALRCTGAGATVRGELVDDIVVFGTAIPIIAVVASNTLMSIHRRFGSTR